MKKHGAIRRALRRRLMAQASALALRVALRPRSWASGLLMVGLIGAPAPVLAQETVLTTNADVTIQGGARRAGAGKSVSGVGDVNGDGIDDLIIGALGASPKGRKSAGAGYVVFGAAAGLPPTIDLATGTDLIIQGAAAGDYAGYSVSGAGDVNGDGIDDLIIGAPHASPKHRHNAGASYVVFGAERSSRTIDLAASPRRKVLVIQGAAAGDYAGQSVSGTGDVNGDGIDDLIIGANYASPEGRNRAGASYVVFGKADGFPAIIDLASDADLIIEGANPDDLSGFSVSGAGDVDHDGIGDLIVGAITASPNGRTGAGATYVVLGAMDLGGTVDLADPINGADLIIQGAKRDDLSGSSVSGAGDVNGDGIDDLLIGAPGAGAGVGAGYVVFGTDRGLPPTIDLATDADVTILGTTTNDKFGGSVSGAGDADGDGIDDLIIGAPFSVPDGRPSRGVAYVVRGATDLAGTIDVADPVNGADLIINSSTPSLFLDISVSGAGDLNHDGFADLVVGSDSVSPRDRLFAGESYVVLGGPAAALERLIAEIEAKDLPRALENRLTGKLENALKAVNNLRVKLAILRLREFRVAVTEARRGKKIRKADAADWIADANAVIDMLRAQRGRAPQQRTLTSVPDAR